MKLNEICDNIGARKKKFRVGRGIGSGSGKTASRGHKGHKSRSGCSLSGYEGGQTPLYRRLPKRGGRQAQGLRKYKDFTPQIVSLRLIQNLVDAGKISENSVVNQDLLLAVGALKKRQKGGVCILGCDTSAFQVGFSLRFSVQRCSAKAKELIEKSGSTVDVVPSKGALGKEVN